MIQIDVPQGSVLGSAFFNIFTNDINVTEAILAMLADDTVTINFKDIYWKLNGQAVGYLGVYLDTKLIWKFYINKQLNFTLCKIRQTTISAAKQKIKKKLNVVFFYPACNFSIGKNHQRLLILIV